MKILGIQLLRIGDVLMSLPALQQFKRENPQCEIHMLVNDEFQKLAPLVPLIDQFHFFRRNDLQKLMVNSEEPILAPFYKIEKFANQLCREKFDRIINFTHNRLSGALVGMISASEKVGMGQSQCGDFQIHGKSFEHLNLQPNEKNFELHYSDIFHLAMENQNFAKLELKSSSEILLETKQRVCFQIGTSDRKKTFSPKTWSRILGELSKRNPDIFIELLGGPGEESFLEEAARGLGSRVFVSICTFDEALAKIISSRLLVSVDTSIKHLGTATDVPIVEVALGSSRAEQTGAYGDRCDLLVPKASCYPCQHRGSCSQPSFTCQEEVEVDELVRYIEGKLHYKEPLLQPQSFDVYTTYFAKEYGWYSRKRGQSQEVTLFSILSRVIQVSSLLENEGETLDSLSVSSVTRSFYCLLDDLFPEANETELKEVLSGIEDRLYQNSRIVRETLTKYRILLRKDIDGEEWSDWLVESLGNVKDIGGVKGLGSSIVKASKFHVKGNVIPLQALRTLNQELNSALYESEKAIKIARAIRTNIMELR